jgi:TalC/MipB family fructose-6-phosphate aldolase
MALYVDCAYVDEIAGLCARYPVTGVTTNPSILLAAIERGQRLRDVEVLRALLEVCTGPVFMQPAAADPDAVVAQALGYAEAGAARVVIKLPMGADGMQAALRLQREGVRYAFTAVYSLGQAYCGALAGAEWLIPYFGRLRRAGEDACQRIGDMAGLLSRQGSGSRLLVASLKSAGDVVEAALRGAHDVSAPPAVIRALAEDPLSQDAVRQFNADWERAQAALH